MRWLLSTAIALLAACTSSPRVLYTPADFQTALNAVNQARAVARTCTSGSNTQSYAAAPALSWNGLLGEVARQRAEHIRQTGEFSHYEGSSSTFAVATRSQQNGYRYREIRENLAQGYSTATDAVNAWLASTQGHCNTLMAPNLREMGMVKAGDYWVLVAAEPQ
ncbi:CAP domain-containing protein [Meiothermus sp. CFH 77666]|uniref:CAP domain-containing protein n=1 Tax=Meiothermus sp. CFH 77666 TaxID=2817942 RepID=UPI001AA07238|nr:CAP domain-containing protein [Meiothermus sp. CFH 77666]MBO1435760.1 CAP domain-containing protein [Meiothermus sp. CFH 77666]